VKNNRFSFAVRDSQRQSRNNRYSKLFHSAPVALDPFVEITQVTWDDFASSEKWTAALEIAEISARKRPELYYGWENWAWALHKQGLTQSAYDLLAPIMKGLKLKGPPSGRAAWCLACFSCCLGRSKEAKRWLRLAETLARDKSIFHSHTIREPNLQKLWSEMEEFV
jgi:hypothetical protein